MSISWENWDTIPSRNKRFTLSNVIYYSVFVGWYSWSFHFRTKRATVFTVFNIIKTYWAFRCWMRRNTFLNYDLRARHNDEWDNSVPDWVESIWGVHIKNNVIAGKFAFVFLGKVSAFVKSFETSTSQTKAASVFEWMSRGVTGN